MNSIGRNIILWIIMALLIGVLFSVFQDARQGANEQEIAFSEFLNRVDASIIFRSLTQEEIKQIVDLELNKVKARLIEHAITLNITEEASDWLATEGYDQE